MYSGPQTPRSPFADAEPKAFKNMTLSITTARCNFLDSLFPMPDPPDDRQVGPDGRAVADALYGGDVSALTDDSEDEDEDEDPDLDLFD